MRTYLHVVVRQMSVMKASIPQMRGTTRAALDGSIIQAHDVPHVRGRVDAAQADGLLTATYTLLGAPGDEHTYNIVCACRALTTYFVM